MRIRPVVTASLVAVALAAAFAALRAAPAGAAAPACGTGAHGSEGYAYAGHQATAVAHGIRATITATAAPSVGAGHVAGWVGVGGPGQGAGGRTMWLQVGLASLPNTPTMLYAEITRAGADPVFVPLRQDVKVGESHRVAVLELASRPSWWRAWVDGRPATEPVHLSGSSARWRPIATAESWNGGQQVCNTFAFRFDGVGVATAAGGAWQPFAPGYRFQDSGFAVRRLSDGPAGQRALSVGAVTPYAFEASSA